MEKEEGENERQGEGISTVDAFIAHDALDSAVFAPAGLDVLEDLHVRGSNVSSLPTFGVRRWERLGSGSQLPHGEPVGTVLPSLSSWPTCSGHS